MHPSIKLNAMNLHSVFCLAEPSGVWIRWSGLRCFKFSEQFYIVLFCSVLMAHLETEVTNRYLVRPRTDATTELDDSLIVKRLRNRRVVQFYPTRHKNSPKGLNFELLESVQDSSLN